MTEVAWYADRAAGMTALVLLTASVCLAVGHGIAAGSDSDQPWAVYLYAACGAAVAGLLAWRILAKRARASWELAAWPAAAAIVTGELVVALTFGLLGHHP